MRRDDPRLYPDNETPFPARPEWPKCPYCHTTMVPGVVGNILDWLCSCVIEEPTDAAN